MESITLQTNDSIVGSGELLGQLQFAASSESDGGSATFVVAKVYAQGEGHLVPPPIRHLLFLLLLLVTVYRQLVELKLMIMAICYH